jgi:multidrug efflux pump subunit AcrA (membrane-fusion protein)
MSSFSVRFLTERQRLTLRKFVVGGLVVGGLLIAVFFALPPLSADQGTVRTPAARPLPVESLAVAYDDVIASTNTYTGEVVARRRSALSFELGGLVTAVTVDDGQRVSAGDVLARIDTELLDQQRAELLAQQRAAEARLAELVAGPRPEQIAVARAEVARQRALADFQQRERERQAQLFERGQTGRKEFLDAVSQADAAAAALTAAQEILNELLAGTRPEQLDAQRALVDQLRAAVARIDVQRRKSVLTAPFAGAIARRLVDEGRVIGAGDPIVELIEDGALEARIGVAVRALEQLEVGASYAVEVDGLTLDARLTAVMPALETATRTRTLVLTLPATAAGSLAAGQIARLPVTESRAGSGFWVPLDALVKSSRGLWAVYALTRTEDIALDERRVERRDVEVLHSEADRAFVRGLLSDGDTIVARGANRIVPGQLVRVTLAE